VENQSVAIGVAEEGEPADPESHVSARRIRFVDGAEHARRLEIEHHLLELARRAIGKHR